MLKDKRFWGICGLAAAVLAVVVMLPAGSVAKEHEMAMTKANHFKCYQVLDWTEWEPKRVELKDQFGASIAKVIEPRMLCNPVDKNGEGIVDKDSHLVCYEIIDNPTSETERVKEVQVNNQFHSTTLWVGSSNVLCLPSQKRYDPRG